MSEYHASTYNHLSADGEFGVDLVQFYDGEEVSWRWLTLEPRTAEFLAFEGDDDFDETVLNIAESLLAAHGFRVTCAWVWEDGGREATVLVEPVEAAP